jgi:hypothetical protein
MHAVAIDLIEGANHQILEHPAVHGIVIPLSLTKPHTDA